MIDQTSTLNDELITSLMSAYNVEDDVDNDNNLCCARSCDEDAAFSRSKSVSSHRRPVLRVLRPLKISRTYDHRSTDTKHSSISTLASASTEAEATPTERTEATTSMTTTAQLKESKFSLDQMGRWTERFEELLQFRIENGHCLVPNRHPDNPELAQWTKRQRYQYKLKMNDKRSALTGERIRALDEAGFVWDSHKAVWAERLEELKGFSTEFGHCNVPSRYETNHQLAKWVKRQRRQWKYKMASQANCMPDSRQEQLEALGFVWDMKKIGEKVRRN